MLVRRIELLLIIVTSLYLGACANKTLDGVFPGTQQGTGVGSDACTSASLLQNQFIVQWEDGHTSVETSENAELFKQKFILPQLGKISHVEFDQKLELHSAPAVRVSAVGSSTAWGQNTVFASSAWNAGINGQGVLVGVVDAAVDYTHPQIQPRLAPNQAEINGRAGIDDDGNGFVDDFYGWDFQQNQNNPANIVSATNDHGTHVSGIIAADHSRGSMQGVAPQAQIVPANFMDASGSGSLGAAIQAIQYVSMRGVKVINASWGGPVCSQTLKAVVNNLASQNILFVVASGNDGVDLDSVSDYPASFNFPNQVTVAASNSSDFLTSWSNTSFNIVHLGAPGDSIYSTVPGGYAYMSGTSMATPFVTGTAALLWSLRPAATYAQIKQALLAGVDNKGFRVKTQGRLNISNSINALKQILP